MNSWFDTRASRRGQQSLAAALILAVLSTFSLALPVFAQDDGVPAEQTVVLTDEQGQYVLGSYLDILEDPGGSLTIADVSSLEYDSSFQRSQANVPVYGISDSAFWLRLKVHNDSSLTQTWLLEANFPNLNYIDLYVPEGNGYQVKQSGALLPFPTREIPYYHVVFRLPLRVQSEQTFYIRVKSGSSMTLAFTLWLPETFAVKKISYMLVNGLFYGTLFITLGYHLFLFFSLKEAHYLYFCGFILASILFFSSYEGLADQFIWPFWSQYKLYLLVITQALFFISALVFSDAFLEQTRRARVFHRVFLLIAGSWVSMIVLVWFSSYAFMSRITAIFILGTPVLAITAGVYSVVKKYKPARLYLISWVGFMSGIIVAELVRLGVVQSSPFTERSYHLGLVWLVLLWSLALADRINLLKAETDLANRELASSKNVLSQILEGLPLGVTVYGKEKTPTFINRRTVDILSNPERGITPSISAGRTLSEALEYFTFRVSGTDQFYPIEKLPIWQAYEGKATSIDDIEADLVDRRVPLEIWANPVRDENGVVVSVVATFQDITERRKNLLELEHYRQKLELLVSQRTYELDRTNMLLKAENSQRRRLEEVLRLRLEWMVVVNQVVQSISDTQDLPGAYLKLTRIVLELFEAEDAFLADLDIEAGRVELLYHSCQETSHGNLAGCEFHASQIGWLSQNFQRGKPLVFNRALIGEFPGSIGLHFGHSKCQTYVVVSYQLDEKKAALLGLEFHESDRLFSADEITLLEKICMDISLVREKARDSEQNQSYIAAEERSRLARDLHDSVTQTLFSVSLIAEVLPQVWQRNPSSALNSLDKLRRLSRGALAEMRTLLLELRPSSLLNIPLGDLLAQLAEAVTARAGLRFDLFIEQIPPIPEDVHLSFYRIAQESLNNVIKHANSSQVSVSLSANPIAVDEIRPWTGSLRLVVRDEGRGFAVERVGSNSLGLGIMRERASAVGANLLIDSQEGRGTTVSLTWSLVQNDVPGKSAA